MAQLKDLLVSGPSRLVGDVFTNKIQATQLFAPTAAGGSTYGAGTNGQVLKTNGTSIYWGADTNSITGVKGNAESSYRTGSVNLTQANIIGSSAIGSTTRPIYYTGSAFSGTTATVGSTTRPIYMNAGVLSGTTATVGGTTRPVYLNAGVISGTTATVGAANKPIYMSGGVLTATVSTIGGASQIMYMSGGVLTAGTTLGSFATRNSLAWNEITQSGANNIDEGSSDFTDNTEIFSSYASNNGFADSNAVGKVYRRDAIKMYNYISGKLALGTAAKVASGTFSLSGHTHSYLPLSGGTMNGSIKWTSTSLPEQTGTPQYLVVIDAFTSGGTQKWKSASSVSVGSATTASKLGSSNIGTNTKFIYLESGTPKASTANVGGATTPIYISGGVLTAGTALGNAAYTNSGIYSLSGHTHSYYPKWQTTSTTTDNTLYDYGVYVKQGGATVSPTGSAYFSILNIPYRKAAGNTKADYAWSLGNSTGNDKRLFFRTSNADNYSSWQEVAHGEAGTAVGSATLPVYMTSSGVITACSGTLAASIQGNAVGNSAGYLAFPGGGSYYTSTATVTGALKITVPRFKTNCMINFDVNISTYDESVSNLVTYRIYGYEYGDGGWHGPVCKVVSDGKGDKINLKVRWGYENSKACVTIGETNTTWKYPQVSISNITYGYSDVAMSSWGYGWSISFVTTLPTLTKALQDASTHHIDITGNAGSASKLGTSTVGSHTKGIWLSSGAPVAMSGTVGSATKPVYMSSGTITVCSGTLAVNISGNAATASKLGTANKGSTVKGIYLSSGSPAEMSYSLYATVNSGSSATNKVAYYSGNNAVSVYTSTVGSHTKGMWLNGGVPTAMSGTVGTAKRPVYLSSGTVTAVNWTGTSLPANSAGVNGDIFFLRL